MENFKSIFGNLELNMIEGKSVQFLDLIIEIDAIMNRLNFSLYIKKTNTFQYVKTDSNHPKHIFKNVPKSLFIRIRRICTAYSDYLFHARNLIYQLTNRGYTIDKLVRIAQTIGNVDRNSLICYKNKKSFKKENRINTYLNFDFNQDFLKDKIKNSFNNLSSKYEWTKSYEISVFNKMQPNLNMLFVNNFYFNSYNFSYHKCNKEKCITCEFSLKYSFIKLNNFYFPMITNSSCDSKGCIYIIVCLLCKNTYYIGETQSIKERMSTHRSTINNFDIYNTDKNKYEVGYHFALRGHRIKDHFRFLIFDKNIFEKEDRLSKETDVINLFKNNNMFILNSKSKQPYHCTKKSLCFNKL